MSAAFCSGVVLDAPGAVPSRVTLMVTYGMVVFPGETARGGSAPFVFKLRRLPAASMLAAIDVERFAGDEFRPLKIEDRINDVTDFSHATDRM
jgi:hypothetical protein